MPQKPSPAAPTCPHCGALSTRNGSNANGSARYLCKGTPRHSWSESTGRKRGGQWSENPSPITLRTRKSKGIA